MSPFAKHTHFNITQTKALSSFSHSKLFASLILLSAIIFAHTKAHAANIYDKKNDQVAGVTALMSAVVSNDIQGVAFFAKSGQELINQQNYGGATALHLAARGNRIEIAKILIKNGAKIDARDNEEWTPLMRATLAGNVEMIQLLLENGAQADAKNSISETIIYQAIVSNCNPCLVAILDGFNFPKYVEFKTLTNWLNHAYSAAHNKGNQKAQEIISAYLDNVLAVEKNGKKDHSNGFDETSLVTTNANGSKLFRFKKEKETDEEPIIEEVQIEEIKEVAQHTKGSDVMPAPIKFFTFKPGKAAEIKPILQEQREAVKEKSEIIEEENKADTENQVEKTEEKKGFFHFIFKSKKDQNKEENPKEETAIIEADIAEEALEEDEIEYEEQTEEKQKFFSLKAGQSYEKEEIEATQTAEEEISRINEEIKEEKKKKFRFKWWGKKDVEEDEELDDEVLDEEIEIEEENVLESTKPRLFKFKKGGEAL